MLVDERGVCKICDFGCARLLDELHGDQSASLRGTVNYMSPEVVRQKGYGRSADIWSLGCTVVELATGKPPWSEHGSQVATLFQIATATTAPPLPEGLHRQERQFIETCLVRRPKSRPNILALLRLKYLGGEQVSAQAAAA